MSHCCKDFWAAHYPHSWALSQECNRSPRTIECERKDGPWCQIPWPTRPESTQQVLGFCSWCWLGPCAWPHTPNLSRQKIQLQSFGSRLLWHVHGLLRLTTACGPLVSRLKIQWQEPQPNRGNQEAGPRMLRTLSEEMGILLLSEENFQVP